MLPTPPTTHVDFARVYEPAEDSYLFLDTLSSAAESAFLRSRFHDSQHGTTSRPSASPFVVEIGTGSGIVLAFVHAHASAILGRSDIITAGVDVNYHACKATQGTIALLEAQQALQAEPHGFYLGNVLGDLTDPLVLGQVDILIFNPPYVPTSELPVLPSGDPSEPSYDNDSHLLSLSYAGGAHGMETTDRLLDALSDVLSRDRGCAYILLCAQNKPEEVKTRIKSCGNGWSAETVARSGKQGGWENLQIVRIWQDRPESIAQ